VEEMMNQIKVLVFLDGTIIISEIEEVPSELGEPDCKLTNAFTIDSNSSLCPWLSDYSSQKIFMVHSDKILTIIDPRPTLIEKYQSLIK
jgi:hypothetical protein